VPVHQFPAAARAFSTAIEEMTRAPLRPEVHWTSIPAPGRMAPHTWAANGEVILHDEEVASGRLVVLHDPAGEEAWKGEYRMVVLVQAQLEPEFAIEAMLGDVAWSWVTESLELFDAESRELGCTATRVVSQSYGALAGRPSTVDVEMRVSLDADELDDLALPRTSPPGRRCSQPPAACRPLPPQVAPLVPSHRARSRHGSANGEG
jgi:hypothetical protein